MSRKAAHVAGSPSPSPGTDVEEDLEVARDLINTLTATQKDLVIGLWRGSASTIATLRARIPKGTRELLECHHAIDAAGNMTRLGELVADQLAFEAGEGPDPRLLARAADAEARLLGA
jgi:hypothetical protein